MKAADENMIKLMNAHKAMVSGSIKDGYIIKEVEYKFVEETLFNNKVKVMLPEAFKEMPINIARMKYPMEQRPSVIRTNENMDIDISLNIVNEKYSDEQAKQALRIFKAALGNFNPNNKFIEEKIETTPEGKKVAWFDFISHGLDGRMYNFMFFTSVGGKLMNGVCNCAEKDVANWSPVFKELITTIKVAD